MAIENQSLEKAAALRNSSAVRAGASSNAIQSFLGYGKVAWKGTSNARIGPEKKALLVQVRDIFAGVRDIGLKGFDMLISATGRSGRA